MFCYHNCASMLLFLVFRRFGIRFRIRIRFSKIFEVNYVVVVDVVLHVR